MQVSGRTNKVLLICIIAALIFTSGCVDWKKKYEALNVEHQNLKGLIERERAEKGQLASQVAQDQQTIEALQSQISEKQQTAGQATGFGDEYDVSLDAAAGTITVTLPNAILFESGKASLKQTTQKELDHIADVIQSKYAGKRIDVVGHTDTDPIKKSSWQDNWELSAQRALSVLRYLNKKGIPSDLIRASGCGESRPIASNSTSAGKAKNRRVEIVVHMR